MSKFLEIPKSALTLTCLHKEAQPYILQELRPSLAPFGGPNEKRDGNEEELIQISIDKSNGNLRMYGSAQELLENINIYKNFPVNNKFFGTFAEPYQTRPRIFTSSKNEQYIAKSDVFVILQNMIVELGIQKSAELATVVACYLKSNQQAKLGNSIQFVKFDEKRFEEIEKEIKSDVSRRQHSPGEFQQFLGQFSSFSKPSIFEVFQRIIQREFEFPANQYFYEEYLERYVSSGASKETMAKCFYTYNQFSYVLYSIIHQNLDLFMPSRTVRVFEDGDQKFLMKSEIFNTKPQKSHVLETITMEELFKNHETHNIEFIRYPITRAKHKATPVQGPSGKFYILAIDFFFEYLRELIHGIKVFRQINPANLSNFLQKINGLDGIFYETETPYFLELNVALEANVGFIVNRPAKDVRNAKKDGFTVQNLKNELAHLGLTTTFPDIQNYAEVVYSEVDRRKKKNILRTCDLFDAVEQCQLNCILERLPKLKKFVHSQKGCYRVYGLKCEDCNAENPETQENQKLSILEKELADLKIAHQKILEENQHKSLEIQELQQKNLRLSVKNETNEVKMKHLSQKLAQTKLSIDDGNYSNACTSQQKIQCLICEKSIESGEDQIIRCPLCKRRFHSKCAINWLKEHQQCPACNGELPKQ
ncbi:hypothetical protein B9Z55_004369 [Caenorhabditis nigoni]|uniref:RING-type domain-containing protein n=1 Tax=Caenorhabditis nigoni TaxID=1611254 RepID=A0A2G5UW73_9PELO|nr:hypothetical protein B9Z55_004369 [Caenorhabditis nigoni]